MPPGSPYLFLTFAKPEFTIQRVKLDGFVIGPVIGLDSLPLALGAVQDQQRVFVSQDHPDGRLTFVQWSSAEVATVTGFEINSRIRD